MRGEIKPGALCLILPLPRGGGSWNCVTVTVGERVPQDEVERDASEMADVPWWTVEAKDGVARRTQLVVDGVLIGRRHTTCVCIPEPYLMPIDPDSDVRAEPRQQATIHQRQDGRRTVRAHQDCATTEGST